ncbi:hypothetical protein KP509_06G022700 [Ceratopteris richardii]|uniref:TF-B3 domain-containing protein n=1 Tax=Ceratopteris richardii TaxID=49495 RepID=A0A8T2UGE5_CERRI|nr:hypothetical protein KP509_20G036200 [Ceratopteris richardii]KAH7434552.1 hypothetical protein KP509_06G022700 [Ceratopteris richardii]
MVLNGGMRYPLVYCLQSHVTGGFWLGLPVAFCRDYLPRKDDRIVLEGENGDEWETIYLATKTGLSGGWRGFSLDHGLVDGDALVFELVEPKRFKVHIIRVYGDSGSAELDNVVKQQGQGKINKVRQKLIWECNTPDTVAEDRGSDITEVADKPCRMESDILKCSDVSIASTMEADDACHDCKDEMSYKRRKTEDGHYVNCDTKLDHGITARGISLGANAVKEDSERPNQTSYITDFMRSRKQTDGNVKKESCDIPCF